MECASHSACTPQVQGKAQPDKLNKHQSLWHQRAMRGICKWVHHLEMGVPEQIPLHRILISSMRQPLVQTLTHSNMAAAATQNLTKPTPKPQFYGLYKLRKKESVTFQALVFYSKSNQYFNLYLISSPLFLSSQLGASFFPLYFKHSKKSDLMQVILFCIGTIDDLTYTEHLFIFISLQISSFVNYCMC